MKSSEAIDFALAVKPKVWFPIHDAVAPGVSLWSRMPDMILKPAGVEFIDLKPGDSHSFS